MVVACADMQKPAPVPYSAPRTSCFSDVECPGSKCQKGPNDIQGICAARAESAADGGAPGDPLPAPAVTSSPNDVHL